VTQPTTTIEGRPHSSGRRRAGSAGGEKDWRRSGSGRRRDGRRDMRGARPDRVGRLTRVAGMGSRAHLLLQTMPTALTAAARSLGARIAGRRCMPEIWSAIESARRTRRAKAASRTMGRGWRLVSSDTGYREETYTTFSCSTLTDGRQDRGCSESSPRRRITHRRQAKLADPARDRRAGRTRAPATRCQGGRGASRDRKGNDLPFALI